MPASSPCSEPPVPPARHGRLIVLEGMPGAGKTTAATALAGRGHSVVGEYTSDTEATLAIGDHPDVSDDDAHQANWLRKAAQCAARLASRPVVYADRDWLSSLSYACAAGDAELLASRARWAARHLDAGTLLLPDAYAVFDLDAAASLSRRAGRLRPGHPWNQPAALSRLRDFYRDPARALRPVCPALAAALGIPERIGISGYDGPRLMLDRLAGLAAASA
ncbi:MAG: AAA family ATPase [Trebonia sp.]